MTGLVERYAGSTSLDALGSLAKRTPVLAVLFFVPAMNLAGIPPFSGFIGKLGLLQAGVDVGTWPAYVLVAGGVVTSLLTLYAIAKVWNRAFWQEPQEHTDRDQVAGLATATQVGVRTPLGMLVPTAALVAVGVGITVIAGPLFGISDRAAQDLLDRAPYVDTVLQGGGRPSEVGS